jgi:hypothetical protein
MKRTNPHTNLPFKQGDMRSDGFIFSCYLLNKKNKQGFYLERWYSEKTYKNYKKQANVLNKTNNKEKRKNRKHFIDSLKTKKGCVDCGYDKHPEALQFDHLPEHIKKFNISKSCLKPLNVVLNEIKKCEIVCACCHAIRTHKRRS